MNKLNFVITCDEGDIRFEGDVDCTFKQLIESLDSALASNSFITLRISPAGARLTAYRVINAPHD